MVFQPICLPPWPVNPSSHVPGDLFVLPVYALLFHCPRFPRLLSCWPFLPTTLPPFIESILCPLLSSVSSDFKAIWVWPPLPFPPTYYFGLHVISCPRYVIVTWWEHFICKTWVSNGFELLHLAEMFILICFKLNFLNFSLNLLSDDISFALFQWDHFWYF